MNSSIETQGMTNSVLESKSFSLNQVPKFGILIPNRVFVGSIAGNTTETELKQFFSTYGPIRDCKIILDKAGLSKGYGFVTFESAEDVSKLLKQEGEHVFFNDRKLNIGPAVRKQQGTLPFVENSASAAASGAVMYANGTSVAFPSVLPLIQGQDGVGMPSLPQIAGASYPMMFGPHQQFLMQSNCYASAWAAMFAPSSHLTWPTQQAGCMSVTPNSHLQMPAVNTQLTMPPAGHNHYLYPYQQMPTSAFLQAQELVYPQVASLQYPDVDGSDAATSYDVSSTQGNNIMMDSGGVSGQFQYIEVSPYGATAATAVAGSTVASGGAAASTVGESIPVAQSSKSSGNSGGLERAPMQNYGIKRVLAIPRQVVCASSNPYGFYTVPPVKIIAGQGGQRIVTKSVGTTEIQVMPKTQT